MNTKRFTPVAGAVAVLAIAGCASQPQTSPVIEQARSAVDTASNDATVAKYAPTELQRARGLLSSAEASAKDNGAKDPNTANYAYLATQMAHIAEQHAREQVAMDRVKAGESERQKVLLAARENEANSALSQAKQAQADADQARNEAQNAQSEMAAAQAESQRLANELQNVKTAQTSRGLVLTLNDVLFDTGRSELKPGARRTLDQIATFLNEHPDRRVQIEGFTDSQGSEDINQQLSQRRADAVAGAIMQRGIDAQRVQARGYGEEFPVASNANAGSRQLNRRVEIIVGNHDEPIPERTDRDTP